MDKEHRYILEHELELWHRAYLPIPENGVILDIGAGNGETARFYLNHGAKKVICIEPEPSLLYKNFQGDSRILILPFAIDAFKSDCEGAELNAVIETHFPAYFENVRPSAIVDPGSQIWKIRVFHRNTIVQRKLWFMLTAARDFVRNIMLKGEASIGAGR